MKRALCLIIDSEPSVAAWRETYDHHRQLWHRCLDLCPWVDGYFLRSDPTIKNELVVGPRQVTVRREECHGTILYKSLRALEALLRPDHDYVVRTNVSSLYDFPLLAREPARTGLYSGCLVDGAHVTGSGILLSNDVARALVGPRTRQTTLSEWDDVAIWQILSEQGVRPEHRDMFIYDYSKGADQIVVGKHLHYRLRDYSDPHRAHERAASEAVFDRLYGAASC
jgi:hypothetical protein